MPRRRERDEGVGAVCLARPRVRVAEVASSPNQSRCSPKGMPSKGTVMPYRCIRQAGSEGAGFPLAPGADLPDWLAVPSSVPSSAHWWTRPWPYPSATAWMRMSRRTHSVGTRRAMRIVLSRLRPPARQAEGLADAERHVVAQDGERRRRHLDVVRAAGPTTCSGRRRGVPSG